MNLIVRNIAESCSEQEVREFLKHELGHYAKNIEVVDAGKPSAYAMVELDAEVPYVGEVIARQIHGKQLGGQTLEASADLFTDEPPAAQ
ncbi:RNA recognition motif-containing protein [Paraburkholderia sp. BL27I4N3]|uniref:RNA-binding protein n=1 Tax=Paraburkholderia sp. BL27I4N3 TaxID=1938805 RepID=UPI000E24B635|nr:RNA-binding protein [Paraburkholderia sp. BL27I4N3]REE24208.1 RNA recognition motif-containing protein [Paraburkholderia sp. BL27I4N3]